MDDLRASISSLEARQAVEAELLKLQMRDVYESIQPMNLLKRAVNEMLGSGGDGSLLSSVMGMAAGYISRAFFVGGSHNIFKKLFGTAIMMGVNSFVSKHPDEVESVVDKIIHFIRSKFGEAGAGKGEGESGDGDESPKEDIENTEGV